MSKNIKDANHEEPKPPQALKRLQESFSTSIRTPVSFATGKFVWMLEAFDELAVAAILPRGEQSARDRLAIYNEQYWYRLFTLLQEDFSLLARDRGFWKFNQLASAYLEMYPSRSQFLEKLTDDFLTFLQREGGNVEPLDFQIATLELAILKTFHVPSGTKEETEKFLTEIPQLSGDSVLLFPKGFTLFAEDWNIVERRTLIQLGDEAKPSFKPEMGYWVIFKKEGRPEMKSIDEMAFKMLTYLVAGHSIGEACEKLSETLAAADLERLPTELPRWFSDWTASHWFQGVRA
jgi:hypothetical protein